MDYTDAINNAQTFNIVEKPIKILYKFHMQKNCAKTR